MPQIESLKRKIKSSNDLLSIVKTMKVLAAVSIRQYEEAAAAVGQYFDTVELGLQILFKNNKGLLKPPDRKGERRWAMIIFGSGQPMCGQFNDVLAGYVENRLLEGLEERPARIVAMGSRMAAALYNHGIGADTIVELPGSVVAINERVEELVLMLERWYTREGYESVVLFNNRPVGQTGYIPARHQVLPIDRDWLDSLRQRAWPNKVLPAYSMNTDDLLSMLIHQYIFVSIYKSFAESLSSEQNTRLESMQVAEQRIEDRLSELVREFRRKRQSDITEEIMDIMSGFEALTTDS